jgi:glycosyltransferase involved in cell wall biosynthesis
MTSRAESYGIVYCEAMSNGMPSLATNAGGVGQIVRSDVTGYLADWGPNTVADIADFVVRTWADPAKYRALAESSFRTFNAEFTWEANWKMLGQLLDSMHDRIQDRIQDRT